jgi:hypothetical protein
MVQMSEAKHSLMDPDRARSTYAVEGPSPADSYARSSSLAP